MMSQISYAAKLAIEIGESMCYNAKIPFLLLFITSLAYYIYEGTCHARCPLAGKVRRQFGWPAD